MLGFRRTLLASAFLAAVGIAPSAQATTGWGCFRVINVRASDTLNLRAKPASKSEIVERLVPGKHGILAEAGPCKPTNVKPSKQWCPIRHFNGDRTTEGWARFVFLAPRECP